MTKVLKIAAITIGCTIEWLLIILIAFVFLIRNYSFQTFVAQKASSYLSKELNTKIEIGNSLLLDYVYGYNGDLIKYCKKNKNIFYLQNDIIIYNIASIVIIMNIKKKKQLFYQAHTDEVTCLTVHPKQRQRRQVSPLFLLRFSSVWRGLVF
jgi:hypothetical protein